MQKQHKLYREIYDKVAILSDAYPRTEKFQGTVWEVRSRYLAP